MKVTIVSVIIGLLGTIPRNLAKSLEKLEIKGRMKMFLMTVAKMSYNTKELEFF